jgi:6-phosphofructokinase 1
MGRDAGYIALHSGISTGAEHILIPERKTDIEAMLRSLEEKEKRQKLVNLVVVAEGDDFGGGNEVSKIIRERLPNADVRVCILGHIQRGGAPASTG